MKTKINRKISLIKKRTLDLLTTNQITKHHAKLILSYDFNDECYTRFLMALTERYMRVRGYYKKYPQEVDLVNQEIDLAIQKWKEGGNG